MRRTGLEDGSSGFRLSGGLPAAESADEPACLGAVDHDGRRVAVPEGPEPEERGLSAGAYVRAVQVGVDDECGAEIGRERREGAPGLRALLERARVMAEEDVDLASAGEALAGRPLDRGGPVPAATNSRRPGGKRATVGKTAHTAETEACPGRQVVQAEAERHRAGCGGAGTGASMSAARRMRSTPFRGSSRGPAWDCSTSFM